MIIRLRSRDGLERISVDDAATLGALRLAVQQQLGVPLEQQRLSKDPALLTAKEEDGSLARVPLLQDDAAALAALGVRHGEQLFLRYDMHRDVEPAYRPKPFELRPFGSRVTVADVIAKQRRIERQDKPTVEAVSFERRAADVFQQYVQAALAFSIKRGGLLYGTVGDDNVVRVEWVYEPPQSGSATQLVLERHTEQEQAADFIAAALGLQKVGWVFSQAARDAPAAAAAAQGDGDGQQQQHADWIMSSSEIQQMAAIQGELGPKAVTVLVTWDASQHVHFEAFQASGQAVELQRDGWFAPDSEQPEFLLQQQQQQGGGKQPPQQPQQPQQQPQKQKQKQKPGGPGRLPDDDEPPRPLTPGVSRMRNPKEPDVEAPIIVAGKDVATVDNDWFLCPMRITQHEGPLMAGGFPVENRLTPAQSPLALRDHLRRHAALQPYSARLADAHLLLWLAAQPGMDKADVQAIVEAVRDRGEVMEGYRVIVDSIAGV